MLVRQKDPKGFTVQTSRSELKTGIKNEDGQLRAKENIIFIKFFNFLDFFIVCIYFLSLEVVRPRFLYQSTHIHTYIHGLIYT